MRTFFLVCSAFLLFACGDSEQGDAPGEAASVGGAGEVLPQLTVPLPKGCSPDGRGCGPLDAPGLDLARPDMEARKAS